MVSTIVLNDNEQNDNTTAFSQRGCKNVVVVSNESEERIDSVNHCAALPNFGDSETTMQSDEELSGSRSSGDISRTTEDPPATAEFADGRFRSIEETLDGAPIVRLVEQEDIEVSAEIFVDGEQEQNRPSGTVPERLEVSFVNLSSVDDEPNIVVEDPNFHCDALHEEDIFVEEDDIQPAEIEIEEEDLDSRARDLMPNVAEAIQQPNLHEVDVEQSRLSVSALTTTFALEEDVKTPALPLQAALERRISSGGDNSEDQQLIFDDRTVSAMNVACAEDTTAPLPTFKCQSQEYQERETPQMPPQLPVPSPLNTVQVSGSSNTTMTDSNPGDIPVAPAVLVLDEDLSRQEQSAPRSTLTRSTSQTPEAEKKMERNFWLTIIAITLFLNSVLVGGIVVAGFCAAGKCTQKASQDIVIEVLVPTPAPSRRLAESFVPTLAFDLVELPGTIQDFETPTAENFSPPPTPYIDGLPEDATAKLPGSMAPNVSPSAFGNTPEDPGYDDDDDDIEEPTHPVESTTSGSAQGIPLRLLILIGVLCESVIVAIVFCLYRRRRQRRSKAFAVKDSNKDSFKDESLASNAV